MKIFTKIIAAIIILFTCSIKVNAMSSNSNISIKTSKDSIKVNEEFYISINAENIDNIYTISLDLKFNSEILDVLSIEPGALLKDEKIEFNSNNKSLKDNVKLINFFETYTGSSNGKSSKSSSEIIKIKARLLKECKIPLQTITNNSDLFVGTPNMRVVIVDNLLNKINIPDISCYIQTSGFTTDNEIRSFITDVYKKTFLREPDEFGFSYWYNKLISCEYSVRDFLLNILDEKEFVNKELSNEEFITAMYSIVTNREPDKQGYTYWLNMLMDYQKSMDAKSAKSTIILRICNEAELRERALNMNLKF